MFRKITVDLLALIFGPLYCLGRIFGPGLFGLIFGLICFASGVLAGLAGLGWLAGSFRRAV